MKTTVIHHSADYDGIFCREIARKFLPDAELIGWDFGQPQVKMPEEGIVYVLDLSPDCLNANDIQTTIWNRIIWIDHHKSSIEKYSTLPPIKGYRIDGVAACRLAWQWFYLQGAPATIWPDKTGYVERRVREPLAVRLAGEYDIWDKRDSNAETFQYGLRFVEQGADFWEALLDSGDVGKKAVFDILEHGRIAQTYQRKMDANLVKYRSFRVQFEGLNFLCLNTGQFNSLTFAALDVPETGHDALMGFRWDGKQWSVSLYQAKHRTDIDLSAIAVKHGGGGHRGACGFTAKSLPFLP